MSELVLGTRGSKLALAQSGQVAAALEAASGLSVRLQVISTRGDRIQDRPLPEVGGKGLFTLELEQALLDGSIDLAVHSLKDLPTDEPDGLGVAAYPERVDPRDVLVGASLDALTRGAVVGTGSARRRVQLQALRPDLEIRGVRGNVDTRIAKRDRGDYDAIVLAEAGLARLGMERERYPLDPVAFTPAPGQGVLGVQCAWDNARAVAAVRLLDHGPTRRTVLAERAFLAALGGGCSVPAGAYAVLEGPRIRLRAMLANEAGTVHREEGVGEDPEALGRQVAAALRARV